MTDDLVVDEYRKHIEKDAALERRFQPVIIDEPTVENTISILRGLKSRNEVHHGVEISDGALVTGMYSSHSISYMAAYAPFFSRCLRNTLYLPDKAIDLVNQAASSLRLARVQTG
jgi:ATP-dependent Clp protease ATP-binding subunit ClpB